MNWVYCNAQTRGYKDNVVRLYYIVVEGEDAWNSYTSGCTTSLILKKKIESRIINNGG